MAANHKAAAMRGEVKAAILSYLSKHPSGRSAREVAAAIDRARDSVATRLAELQDTGRIIGILVHHNKGRDYKLWFAPEFEAQARLAGDPGFVRARTVAKALAPKPTRRLRIGVFCVPLERLLMVRSEFSTWIASSACTSLMKGMVTSVPSPVAAA